MGTNRGWSCVRCGNEAGRIAVTDDGELRRVTFTGVLTQPLAGGVAAGHLRDALTAADSDLLYAVDPELAPWWCPTCRASYCGEHWQRWDVFDEGFHDCIRGRCPAGHERLLED